MRLRALFSAVCLLSLAFFSLHAIGQTNLGILVGVVHDPSGAVVPGATISLRGEQTGQTRTAIADQQGAYRADSLNPEPYTLTVTQPGFSAFSAQHVVVRPSVASTFDISLTLGAANETITVEATGATLDTENAQVAGTISAAEISNLPVITQNPIELATTVPGVQIVQSDNQLSNGVNIQVNGARPRSNNFLLDSQEINDVGIGGQAFQPQIQDMYDAVTVITSVANAEFGRAGGGIVNLTTKSGTNHVHGTLFERYSGSGLNAYGGQERGQPGVTKPRFDQHSFGFTLGGPLLRDKLFAFGGAEWQRYYGRSIPGVVQLPDAAGIATLQSITGSAATQVALLSTYLNNFSYLTAYQALNRTPTLIQLGAFPGCAAPCTVSTNTFERAPIPTQNPDTQWSYRIDFKPREADTFYIRYLHDRTSLNPDFFANPSGGLLGLDTQQGGPSELGTGGWTHVFTPNTLNELRASETRINFAFVPTNQTLTNPINSMATISIGGFPSLGPNQNFPQGRAEDLYQFQDTFSWTHGRHSIRAGVDIGRQIEIDTIPQNALGTATFAGGSTSSPALANFLNNQLGASGSITRSIGPTRADPHAWRNGVFAQDDIRVSPDLVANLGIRYDYTTNPENSLPYPAVNPYNPFAPITAVLRVSEDTNNVAPRIGFAYTPHTSGWFANGHTVIRGGFGIFYDNFFSNFVTNAATSAPNSVSGTIVGTTANPQPNAIQQLHTFTPTLGPTASVLSVASNLVNPQTFEYNLGFEHELPGAFVIGLRYVGNHAEKLFASDRFNPFNGLTGLRVNPARGAVSLRENSASSNYNGLVVEATHTMRHGLFFSANYTFSKDLDNGSEIFGLADTGDAYPANPVPGGRRQEWGPSAYDHRHFFSISYVWTVPSPHLSNKTADTFIGAFLRNWTVSGVEQLQSGPYSSFNANGFDINGDGDAFNDRPLLSNRLAPVGTAGVDGALVGGTPGVFYDVTALNSPSGAYVPIDPGSVRFLVPYTPSNALVPREIGRNSFENPGTTVHTIALQKGFGTGLLHLEKGQFILRAEASDFPNHNDRGYLDTDVMDFGADTSFVDQQKARVDTGRTLVLWARFLF